MASFRIKKLRFALIGLFGLAAFLRSNSTAFAESSASPYFAIKVVDAQTGRGVPLVELRTVNNISYYTDSNGIVAFHEPGLMNRKVFFSVRSDGYEFPKDGFGFAGIALEVKEGGRAELKIKRINLAERLYRITGEGIYRDSVLTGEPTPIREPLLNGEVTGQDSVAAVRFQDKLYWFWGDTNRVRYPLGQFAMSGATSALPGKELDPAKGIDLTYFTDAEGFSRPMAPLGEPGAVWLDGLTTLPDEAGVECMISHYVRLKELGKTLEHGMMVWDEKARLFRKQKQLDLEKPWQCLRGHTIRWKDSRRDVEYILSPMPFSTVRVRDDWKSVFDPDAYEALTCLVPGSRYQKDSAKVERGPDGKLLYDWKRDTDPTGPAEEQELIAAGKIRAEEARHLPVDIDGGKPVRLHLGSIAWNEFRKKWILIAVEIGGASMLGEVWFSEAESPLGPWRTAKKIVTHDDYSFYNPVHHPFFDQEGGRVIYFEGTYSSTFSGNKNPTPRYDYNQIMYRLDLGDPRLGKLK
jgi:hypothetical protein